MCESLLPDWERDLLQISHEYDVSLACVFIWVSLWIFCVNVLSCMKKVSRLYVFSYVFAYHLFVQMFYHILHMNLNMVSPFCVFSCESLYFQQLKITCHILIWIRFLTMCSHVSVSASRDSKYFLTNFTGLFSSDSIISFVPVAPSVTNLE